MGPLRRRWIALHRDVERGRRFVDEQVAGPFARWVHAHAIERGRDGGSLLEDSIEYELPLGGFVDRVGVPVVERRLRRLFTYRERALALDLAAHRRAGLPPLRIAVTGASGLIGGALVPFLTTGGHEVLRLVRGPSSGSDEVSWSPRVGTIDAAALAGVDAVVHLAGAPVAGRRWTAEYKDEIRASRVEATRLLAQTLAGLERPPRVLLSASAVGWYGDRGDEEVDETSPPGRGFLAEVTPEWEAATDSARAAGIRVVLLRFGVVLSPRGGALARMLPAFRLGVGGPLGDGGQYVSWVSIDDAIGAVLHLIAAGGVEGPVNVVAPAAVTSRDLARTLGRVLGRPARLQVPAPVLRIALGEIANEALLTGARVVPRRLTESGYAFRDPSLEGALRQLLGAD